MCTPRGKDGRGSLLGNLTEKFQDRMACRNKSRHHKEEQRMALIILGLSFTQSLVGSLTLFIP